MKIDVATFGHVAWWYRVLVYYQVRSYPWVRLIKSPLKP